MSKNYPLLETITTSGSSVLSETYSSESTYSAENTIKVGAIPQEEHHRFVTPAGAVVVSTPASRHRDEVARINLLLKSLTK